MGRRKISNAYDKRRTNKIACNKITQDQNETLADKDWMLQLMQQLNLQQEEYDNVIVREKEEDNDGLTMQLGDEEEFTPVRHGKKTQKKIRPNYVEMISSR